MSKSPKNLDLKKYVLKHSIVEVPQDVVNITLHA